MIRLTGLAAELRSEIEKIPVVDCHEHLPTETERVAATVDVTTLFSHYCKADLEAAGLLQGKPQDAVFDTSKPLGPRWEALKPCVEAIRYGSYAYPAFAYVRDVLGIDDICDDTVEAISARLQADNQPGLFKKLIQDTCGIELCIQCGAGVISGDQPFFRYLCRARHNVVAQPADLCMFEREVDVSIRTLDDCVTALNRYVARQKEAGAVGLKVGDAYSRTLRFDDVAGGDAERVLVKARSGVYPQVSQAERMLLENYLMRRQVEACIEHGMPVVIHTGYQAGNRNDIRNTRATELWSLLKDYPNARFDLFHGSFPYVSDMTVLGKYFENVTLNMCWMHIMGPEISRRALAEWLDAVPVTKIFAFGGDYAVPEKIFGHLQLARADLAVVLADKVEAGRMSEAEALKVARLLLNENPKRWYGLT